MGKLLAKAGGQAVLATGGATASGPIEPTQPNEPTEGEGGGEDMGEYLYLPEAARPALPRKGKYSFTVRSSTGAVIEVQDRKSHVYFIKKVAVGLAGLEEQEVCRVVNWNKHGGPVAAWDVACRLSGF
eukprot:3107094-Alexandrium_andersonii.AAC.1